MTKGSTLIRQEIIRQFKRYNPKEKDDFYQEFSRDEELAEVLGRAYDSLNKYITL